MNIVKATKSYEEWVRQFVPIVSSDLAFKHNQMRADRFSFFRATYYRWAQLYSDSHSESTGAPDILSVGDLHVENYGTWRDAEARLIWGVNDFDEASYLPYTNDLVRLAASVELAVGEGHLRLDIASGCDAILDGYRSCLREGARPFVLEGEHDWLRRLATGIQRSPVRFWERMSALPKLKSGRLEAGIAALKDALPLGSDRPDYRARRAGLGSLGHPRYVAIAEIGGGRLAREAKLLAPSAAIWATHGPVSSPVELHYGALVRAAARSPDPQLALEGSWVVRRLAPSCTRIELSMLPAKSEELQMVRAMGFELGNIHSANRNQLGNILSHERTLPKKWLRKAAGKLVKAVSADFESYGKRS